MVSLINKIMQNFANGYTITSFVLGVAVLILFLRVIKTYRSEISDKSGSKTDIIFTLALAAATGTFIGIDLIWEIVYSHATYHKTIFEIVNFIYYLGYVTLPCVWYCFAANCYQKSKKSISYILTASVPILINLFLIIATVIDNSTLWTIGYADNRYVRGTLSAFSTLLNMVYFLSPIFEMVFLKVFKKRELKAGLISTSLFTLIPAMGMFIYRFVVRNVEYFPFQTFSAFIGLLFAYFFIVEETNRNTVGELLKGQRIIKTLVSEYSYVFYVDIASGTITSYGNSDFYETHVKPYLEKGAGLRDAFEFYIKNVVFAEDQDRILKEYNVEQIIDQLQHQKSYELIFRIEKNNSPEYRLMKFVKVDEKDEPPTEVAMAIMDKNEEIIFNYIDEELIKDYSSLVYIDCDRDIAKAVKISNEVSATRVTDLPYNKIYENISALVAPDYEHLLKNVCSTAALKEFLKDDDSHELIFELRGVTHALRRSEWKVLERKNGIPSIVLATVRNMDNDQAKRLELTKIIEAQNVELSAAKAIADNANEAKSKFLFNMSHDIRTPMNAIMGYTNMAHKCIDDKEKVEECLEKIDIAGQHLLTLINEVLDMSRIETGNIEISRDPENVITKAMELVSICKELADKKDIELDIITKNVRNADVLADGLHVDQILTNIIGNAIKYTNPGGRILYTVEQTKLDVDKNTVWFKFTVADTGIGMKPDFLNTIFETFSREKNTTMSGVEGTGLGMSIVKQLVDLLGGEIHIESAVDIGTKVTVDLPFELQTNAKIKEEEESITTLESLAGKRALIVEDNEMNREIAAFILEDLEAEVEDADDGDVAVEKLKTKGDSYYDFVLMDIQMPRMDGYKATKEIRLFDKKTPIIAMTANAFEEDKRKALACGMNAHIAKPVEVEILLQTLSSIL